MSLRSRSRRPQPPVPMAAWHTNPLLLEIIEVLLNCGGSAHRELIAREIAWRRTRLAPSSALRREVFAVLDVHSEEAAQAGERPIVYRPFGDDSYRWAIALDAKVQAQAVIAARAATNL